jgi:hypothetical protein
VTTTTEVQFLSAAQSAFEVDAVPQVQRLIDIHKTIGGTGPGRRRNLESLNKSAIVLTCAFWEAFVEDLASESLRHLAEHAESPSMLPLDLRKSVVKAILRNQKNKNELAPWDLAGDGGRPSYETPLPG